MPNDAERVSDIVVGLRARSADAHHAFYTRLADNAALDTAAADIIEAQSKALAEARVVKPLEWEDGPNGSWAQSIVGPYHIEWRNAWVWNIYSCDTKDEAKAAAQADYATRILSALTPTPENPNG
jgi:hypothetical protein